ncbi:Uncharacterised protein [Mycobacteroides abscessus subsp. abscessus]|nr:Uncharacterised protein [Mycobacteroides abscessus subsp. abscessus]
MIQTDPSPTTIIQCHRDHGSRSRRAGIRVRTVVMMVIFPVAAAGNRTTLGRSRYPSRRGQRPGVWTISQVREVVSPGSSQCRPRPELSASGGAVIGSTAIARPGPSGRGNVRGVKTWR